MAWQLFVLSSHSEIHLLESNHALCDLPHERNARGLQILVRAYSNGGPVNKIFSCVLSCSYHDDTLSRLKTETMKFYTSHP